MELGAFSVSLAVKDLQASKAFYENIGFSVFHGEESQNWLILKNGDHVIGLFQDMFPNNILTFNPGWDQNGQPVKEFADIRQLHKDFKGRGLETSAEQNLDKESGPGSFSLTDPDGNAVLFDQHV